MTHSSPEFLYIETMSNHEGKTNSEPQKMLVGCVASR